MRIQLILHGKTSFDFLNAGISEYEKRMRKYIRFEIIVIPDIKRSNNKSEKIQKEEEGKLLLSKLDKNDYLVLLDERGKRYDSIEFSKAIEKHMSIIGTDLVFVIGGAYGFSQDVYKRANMQISLSPMTFSHQLIRLVFMEQLYRAFTIINGDPYHHK